MAKKLSRKQLAAIHAKNQRPHITFNNKKESKKKFVGIKYTMNAPSNIFNKITPNTVEATVSPIPGFLNVKATWELKK